MMVYGYLLYILYIIILTSTVRKSCVCEASKVHPVETGPCTAEVGIEGSGGELKAVVTQHRPVYYVIISKTGKGPPGGWEKHRTSCVCIHTHTNNLL